LSEDFGHWLIPKTINTLKTSSSMNKKIGFLIRLIIIFAILWTLVWSGVKVWQAYSRDSGWSGVPYKYSMVIHCDEERCEKEWNYLNLTIDIWVVIAVSILITFFTYWVNKKVI